MSRFAATAAQPSLEEILAEAREGFLAWAKSALPEAKQAAPNLGSSGFADAWETVFGILHDLKGGGGGVGLDLVTSIADSACRYLKGKEAADDHVAAVVLAHLNAIEGVLKAGIVGDGGPAGERLLAKLRTVAG